MTVTKYSSSIDKQLSEEWQKHLTVKYINLTELENWRRKNSTKFLLMEIPKSWDGFCGGIANQVGY